MEREKRCCLQKIGQQTLKALRLLQIDHMGRAMYNYKLCSFDLRFEITPLCPNQRDIFITNQDQGLAT